MSHTRAAARTIIALVLSAFILPTLAFAVVASPTGSVTRLPPPPSEISQARSLLADQIERHPILKGTTIEIGDAQGYQAIARYQEGRIIVSSAHTAPLERIVAHEAWHVIDWRDNHRMDWGESVPTE